jgi:hypothetical protein
MISRIIKIATTLFSKISSLPPISMSFISWLIICLFILMTIMCLNYICCTTWLRTWGDNLMKCWAVGYTSCTTMLFFISTWLEFM